MRRVYFTIKRNYEETAFGEAYGELTKSEFDEIVKKHGLDVNSPNFNNEIFEMMASDGYLLYEPYDYDDVYLGDAEVDYIESKEII